MPQEDTMADMRGMLEELPQVYCDAMTGAGRSGR